MSHRQEEKQRRREEREAQEQAEKARAARRQRMQLVIGGLVAVAAIAVVVLLVDAARSAASGDGGDEAAATPEAASNVTIPEQVIGDVKEAAKAAGCKLEQPGDRGRARTRSATSRRPTTRPTRRPPATTSRRGPRTASTSPGDTPQLGQLVHTLEHGRIDVQYKPGTPSETVDQLNALLAEMNDGYHMLLFENTTEHGRGGRRDRLGPLAHLPGDERQGVRRDPDVPDEYIDKGPENVP